MTNRELIFFVAGGALGALITWFSVKDRYEQKYQEEVAEVKEALKKQAEKKKEEEIKEEEIKEDVSVLHEKPDIMQYASKLAELRYSDKHINSKEKKEVSSAYVISPDEFGEIEDYDKISLVYYSGDSTLTDDRGEAIDESVVGDALSHFGEYEDDSVFVRDDKKRCDYEILLDQRAYGDIKHPEVEG